MQEVIQTYMNEIKDDLIKMRRHLHQNPELSTQEWETSKFVQSKLEEFGIPFENGFAKTGALGIIKGGHQGKTVALRADMDALPIQELNSHDFVSKNENVMHACGHDAHTSMLLSTGYILNKMREHIHGTVLLVFQPAEENSPVGGSQRMLDDGVFDTYPPDVIYGQHVWPNLPAGQMGIRDKEMMGASDRFKIIVKGKGGHASMPHLTNDAVVMTGHLITSLQSIVSRNLDPLEASVVTIGKINGGYGHNVIADKVELEGTIRTYNPEIRERLKERFHTITNQVVQAFDGEVEIEYLEGYPATINTPEWAEVARESATKMLGDDAVPQVNPSLAGEDFSRFLHKYPGAFIWLGTQIEDKENQAPLHDPNFKLNEKALPHGSAFLAQVAIDTLNKLRSDYDEQ
ncbi:M20 family metallopeptidase [Virgibacillus kekensis]|uniref:M20 family metallopeptidase n=1 Tax=Virgibacillus kekensis TaxID=202261 RepID=A0ABV9DIC7_9BACI